MIGVGRGICVRKSMRNAATGGTRPSAFSSTSLPSSPATPTATTAAAATVDMRVNGPDGGGALFLGLITGLITGLARGLRRGIRPLSPLPRPLLPPPLLLPPLLPLPLLWLPVLPLPLPWLWLPVLVLVLERLWWLRREAMDKVRSWATMPGPPVRRTAPLSPATPCAYWVVIWGVMLVRCV
jgi:hypothetical protein